MDDSTDVGELGDRQGSALVSEGYSDVQQANMRAFLESYSQHGIVTRAAAAAGIDQSTPYSVPWKRNAIFQAAFKRAQEAADRRLLDAARIRSVEGLKSYKFTRDGSPLRHPEMCECGHGLGLHPRTDDPDDGRGCQHPDCDCARFLGAPYYENAVSDRLLDTMLKARFPSEFSKKVEKRTVLTRLDVSKLPDHMVDRIAAGEPALQVLASEAERLGTTPAALLEGGAAGEIVVGDGEL